MADITAELRGIQCDLDRIARVVKSPHTADNPRHLVGGHMVFVEFTLMFLDDRGSVAQHMPAQDIVKPAPDVTQIVTRFTQHMIASPTGFTMRLRIGDGYPDADIQWTPHGSSAAIATVKVTDEYFDSLWLISRRNKLEDDACLEAFKKSTTDRYSSAEETIGDVRATFQPVAIVSHHVIEVPPNAEVVLHRADAYLASAFFLHVRGRGSNVG